MDILRALLMSATAARHARSDLFSWCVLAYICTDIHSATWMRRGCVCPGILTEAFFCVDLLCEGQMGWRGRFEKVLVLARFDGWQIVHTFLRLFGTDCCLWYGGYVHARKSLRRGIGMDGVRTVFGVIVSSDLALQKKAVGGNGTGHSERGALLGWTGMKATLRSVYKFWIV